MFGRHNEVKNAGVYLACVPHVPLIKLQGNGALGEFWRSYQEIVADFRAFDPELVFIFGSDHYDALFLNLMPSFLIGMAGEALDDTGGYPGPLNVASDVALACAEFLVANDFDIATSYAMKVDHGFSNTLYNFLGEIDAKPIVPIHINALCHPRPTLRRCRVLGEAIGRFAATLGKRVSFLGSGGLSHETSTVFPQYDTAPNQEIRDFIVHGGRQGAISMESWLSSVHDGMAAIAGPIAEGALTAEKVNPDWDGRFLNAIVGEDLTLLDTWGDADLVEAAGHGAGEIRQWVAAVSAARAAGADRPVVDFYSAKTAIGVGSGLIHGVSSPQRL